MVGPALGGFIMTAGRPSVSGNFEKMQIYYLHDLEIIKHTWGHTARSLIDRQHQACGVSAFIRGEGGVLGILQVHC